MHFVSKSKCFYHVVLNQTDEAESNDVAPQGDCSDTKLISMHAERDFLSFFFLWGWAVGLVCLRMLEQNFYYWHKDLSITELFSTTAITWKNLRIGKRVLLSFLRIQYYISCYNGDILDLRLLVCICSLNVWMDYCFVVTHGPF